MCSSHGDIFRYRAFTLAGLRRPSGLYDPVKRGVLARRRTLVSISSERKGEDGLSARGLNPRFAHPLGMLGGETLPVPPGPLRLIRRHRSH